MPWTLFRKITCLVIMISFFIHINPLSNGFQPSAEKIGLFEQTSTTGQSNVSIPTVLSTFYVKANGDNLPTNVLEIGKVYTLRITGIFVWGGCDPAACPNGGPDYLRWRDAFYVTDDHFHHQYNSSAGTLTLDGMKPSTPSYNPQHIYTLTVTGKGSSIILRINDDCCYGDNYGSLRVEVLDQQEPDPIVLGTKPFPQKTIPLTSASWGEDIIGAPGGTDHFCTYGCFVTSWAMLLDYYGFSFNRHTSPRELNNWLKIHDGYTGNYLYPKKSVEYANLQLLYGTELKLRYNTSGRDDQLLHNLLLNGPVILEIPVGVNSRHFVLATGETRIGGTVTWYINDPGGCQADLYSTSLTTLFERYSNTYINMYWATKAFAIDSLASLSLRLASPAELLVSDPQGRQTGIDPRTGTTYNDIPGATYSATSIANDSGQAGPDTHLIKELYLPLPIDGQYSVEVIGTGSGDYSFSALGYDSIGIASSSHLSGQTAQGEDDKFILIYSSSSGVITPGRSFLPIITTN